MFVGFIHLHCEVVYVGRRNQGYFKDAWDHQKTNHQLVSMCFKPFYYLCFLEKRKIKFELKFLKVNELFSLSKVVAKLPKIQVQT